MKLKKTSFLTLVSSIDLKLGLKDDKEAEETRVLKDAKTTKRKSFFNF